MSDLLPRPLATLARPGGAGGEALAVRQPVATIGRAPVCEVVVDDDSVSDRHARLAYENGGWTVTDLGSTNGTAVDGDRLPPSATAPLPYGATLRIGGVKLAFAGVDDADPDAARATWVAPEAPRTLREERSGPRFPVWLLVLLAVLAAVIAVIVYTQVAAVPAGSAATDRGDLLRLAAAVALS